LDRVPYFFLILGSCFAGLSFIGLLLIFEKKVDLAENEENLIINEEVKEIQNVEKQLQDSIDVKDTEKKIETMPALSLTDVLKIKDLYLISFVMCFGGTSLSIFSSNYKVRLI